jgi:hypothetical protein
MSDDTAVSVPAPVAAPAPEKKPVTKKVKKSAPKRAHKSKKEKAKKSSVVMSGGFLQRVKKPEVTGTNFKSRLVRVDADFADYLRSTAMKSGKSITSVTRDLFLSGILP